MKEGFFYWNTDYYHSDNTFTMTDYITNHLDESFEIILDDGSYIEVINDKKEHYSIMASGNGDSFNHKVEIKKI